MRAESTEINTGSAEAILGAAVLAMRRLTEEASWERVVPEVLARLGEAAGVSRVFIFENTPLEEGGIGMSERFEWVAPGITATIEDPDNQDFPYSEGYERYVEILGRGGVICGPACDFPEREAAELASDRILSTAYVPIFAGDEWWGYIGFDDCVSERRWEPVEIGALSAVAGIFGSAIYRDQLDFERRRAEAWLQSHIENIPAVTYIEYTNPDHPLGYEEAYVSPQIETMLGYTPDEWLHDEDLSLWAKVVHPDDKARVDEMAAKTSISGEPYVTEYRMRKKDGTWLWVRDEAHLVEGRDDIPPYWHGMIVDITARKEAEEQVAFLAYHDSLTGLANRALFQEMLEPALARARRHNLSVAVLFMDLDDFKQVNDALGHDMGDLLLKKVASRLREATRETDLVARQGGDEFLVMMSDLEPGSEGKDVSGDRDRAVGAAELMAERIHKAMQAQFLLGDHEVNISLSIGISVFSLDASDTRSLLKNSDAAMYESKRARPGGYLVHARASTDALVRPSSARRMRDAGKSQR